MCQSTNKWMNEWVGLLNVSVLGSACHVEQSLSHKGGIRKESPELSTAKQESKATSGVRAGDLSSAPWYSKSSSCGSLQKGSL